MAPESSPKARSDWVRRKTVARERRLNHGLRQVSEELIQVIQIAEGARADIGGVKQELSHFVAARDLQLSIRIGAAVGKCECSRGARGKGRNNKVLAGIPLLIGKTQRQVPQRLPVEFQTP